MNIYLVTATFVDIAMCNGIRKEAFYVEAKTLTEAVIKATFEIKKLDDGSHFSVAYQGEKR